MARVVNSVTSLPSSPDDDRRKRMRQYTIAMSIRMLCVVLAFVLPGWWKMLALLGAIILPNIAVILANVSMRHAGGIQSPEHAPIVRRPDDLS